MALSLLVAFAGRGALGAGAAERPVHAVVRFRRWFLEPPLPVDRVLMPTFAPRKAG